MITKAQQSNKVKNEKQENDSEKNNQTDGEEDDDPEEGNDSDDSEEGNNNLNVIVAQYKKDRRARSNFKFEIVNVCAFIEGKHYFVKEMKADIQYWLTNLYFGK